MPSPFLSNQIQSKLYLIAVTLNYDQLKICLLGSQYCYRYSNALKSELAPGLQIVNGLAGAAVLGSAVNKHAAVLFPLLAHVTAPSEQLSCALHNRNKALHGSTPTSQLSSF